jgi:ElaB/YqjD/DUF883 family membrane-anchored ribosome-binding protein
MNMAETNSAAAEAADDAPRLEEAIHQLEERLGPQLEEAKEQLGKLNARVKGFIVKNPGACLLGAVAVGYLVGRLAARK